MLNSISCMFTCKWYEEELSSDSKIPQQIKGVILSIPNANLHIKFRSIATDYSI